MEQMTPRASSLPEVTRVFQRGRLTPPARLPSLGTWWVRWVEGAHLDPERAVQASEVRGDGSLNGKLFKVGRPVIGSRGGLLGSSFRTFLRLSLQRSLRD